MSLTTRLSAFFLGALAVVLLGFSLTLYLLAQTYLYRQVDERLAAALVTLEAAVDREPDGLDWDPSERRILLGQEDGPEQIRWLIRSGSGSILGHSANLESADPLTNFTASPPIGERSSCTLNAEGQSRWVLQQQIHSAPAPDPPKVNAHVGEPERPKYQDLILTVALAQAPVQATLRNLVLALAGLSAGLWSAAALLGRWLCRRALGPVTRMAASARQMSEADWSQRLPISQTKDELEDLGHAFNDLLTRLQEAFERQRRFTGDASHQLRTPLTAVLGQLEVLLRRERNAEEYKHVLLGIHGQASKLREIVETLLFLARADSEAKLPDLKEVDLSVWLPEYLQRWHDHPRSTDVHFELLADVPAWACVQAPLLEQLLSNLLENACKYSEVSTPIIVRLSRESDHLVCMVEDRGSGIAPEDLPHVFEPFYRSARARRRGLAGIGLGLAVVQRIAAAFGGSVSVESTNGQGTRFSLLLPEMHRAKPRAIEGMLLVTGKPG
jgi:two-component system OmpR family sensor kinase